MTENQPDWRERKKAQAERLAAQTKERETRLEAQAKERQAKQDALRAEQGKLNAEHREKMLALGQEQIALLKEIRDKLRS